jgi:hypothetical protein
LERRNQPFERIDGAGLALKSGLLRLPLLLWDGFGLKNLTYGSADIYAGTRIAEGR